MPSLRSLLKVAAPVQKVQPLILNKVEKENQMNLLKHIGSFFKTILKVGSVIAVAAEPVVADFAPQLSGLFNTTTNLVVQAEGVAAQTGGTGEQKAMAVVEAITPQINSWATSNGIQVTPDQIKRWNDGVVALLNIFNAPTVPPVAAAVK